MRAVAVDVAGNATTSEALTINVQNVTPDTTNPTAQITSPANNAVVYDTVDVTVSATDNIGVTKVDLLIDGSKAVAVRDYAKGGFYDQEGDEIPVILSLRGLGVAQSEVTEMAEYLVLEKFFAGQGFLLGAGG